MHTNTAEGIKSKTAQAESQEVISFPADGHRAILNKADKKLKTDRKRTNNDKWAPSS